MAKLTPRQIAGLKIAEDLKAKDPLHFSKMGAKGDKLSKTGEFGAGEAGRERARLAGAIGGRISRRRVLVKQ